MSGPAGRIRRARGEEAAVLSALARRSKAHWGYDEAFMRACVAELAVSVDQLRGGCVWLFETDERPLGFYSIEQQSDDEAELVHLFVEPEAIGSGVGRRLLGHACRQALALGCRVLHIESDPNAEAFYRAQGGVRIGQAPSASIAGRELPVLEIALDQGKQIDR